MANFDQNRAFSLLGCHVAGSPMDGLAQDAPSPSISINISADLTQPTCYVVNTLGPISPTCNIYISGDPNQLMRTSLHETPSRESCELRRVPSVSSMLLLISSSSPSQSPAPNDPYSLAAEFKQNHFHNHN